MAKTAEVRPVGNQELCPEVAGFQALELLAAVPRVHVSRRLGEMEKQAPEPEL